jgi:chromosome segregation ATPase
MSDIWKSIKIREFEHVLAAPSVALLRISGKPRRRHVGAGPRPVLLADDGQTVWRFAAIPSPPDDRRLLRAAYSVSSDLVTSRTVFSLELNDGGVIALPAPSPGTARLAPEPDAEPGAESVEPTQRPPGNHERRTELVTKLTELSSLLAESEQARGGLEAAASEARVEADRANEQLAPLRAHTADLEQRLTEADERAIDGALVRAAAEERADDLQRVCQQLEQANEEQREHLRRLEQDVAEAVAARDELEHSVAPLRAAREQAEHELAETQDAIRAMTTERDELSRQASAFDAVAVKARERAAQAEAAAEKATAALREIETWSGELERRLTDTTDELSAAKTARTQDEAELRRLGGEFAEADAKVELLQAQIKILNDPLADAGNGRRASDALTSAREEIEQLRAQLAQAREAEAEAGIDAIRRAAEAEARELAERELAQAATVPQ